MVYITQNLFQQSKAFRTISLNAHYLILFQSPGDKMQIKVLSNQLQAPHMIHAFNDATSKKDKRKAQGVPQSQTAALPRLQEEEETDKPKQAQTEQTYKKH